MAYKINKTDGSLVAEVIDSAVDQTATDLALIGKNVTGYGEYINENFIKLLENFASTSEPRNPIAGQIWFDTGENRLKVYDGNGFRIGGGPIVSNTQPLNGIRGDLWIDSREKLLYFNDGTGWRNAGRIWKESQGRSGFIVSTLTDTAGNQKTVVELRCGETLLGFFSKHAEFTPSVTIDGFAGSIKPGFTAGTLDGLKFNVRATEADALVDNLGNVRTASDFLVTSNDNFTIGTLSISNNEPLVLGENQQNKIEISDSLIDNTFRLISERLNQNFEIVTESGSGSEPAVKINAQTRSVGIFNDNPQATLDVDGDLRVSGDLTVLGDTVAVEVTEIKVEDKNIELASSASPSDSNADGGGIILKGTTDHSLLWNRETPADESSWDSSEHFNLLIGKEYRINGNLVLDNTTLGSSVVNSSLTSVGTLTGLNVSNGTFGVNVNGNTISSVGTLATVPIVLNPKGLSPDRVINVSNSRITGVETPSLDNDAATKGYVTSLLFNDWVEINSDTLAAVNDRLFVSTISGPVAVTLPENPVEGDTIRFFDFDGTFDTNNLTIKRYRRVDVDTIGGTSGSSAIGTYTAVPAVTVVGSGSGLTATVLITLNGNTYTKFNTDIEIVNQGVGYKNGDTVKILGTSLGGTSPANDLVFSLELDNILSLDNDFVIATPDASFGLIYTNPNQGWRLTEQVQLPPTITANVVGNVTGNVTGDVTGDLTGDVTGDLTGTVLTPSQPNITQVGTLSSLTVTGNIVGSIKGNVVSSNTNSIILNTSAAAAVFTGNVSGNLTGNVVTSSIQSASAITVESGNSSISLISGNSGIRLSAYDNTGSQNHYAIQVTPANAAGNRPTTLLFGDVVVSNTTASPNTFGASFRLPSYTTAARDARVMSFLNNGELIYNTDLHKVQAYANGIWVDLH